MIKKIINYGLSEGINKVVPFVLFIYISELLDVNDFANLGLLYIANELFFLIISFNIHSTSRVFYFKLSKSEFISKYAAYLNFNFRLALVCTSIVICVSIFHNDYYMYLPLVLANFLRSISAFLLSILQCESKSREYTRANLIYILSLSSVTFLVFSYYPNYYFWLISLSLASLLQVSYLIIVKKDVVKSIVGKINMPIDTSLIWFGANFFPQAIGWWLKVGGERLVIDNAYPQVLLGNYTLAFQYASLFSIVVTVINLVLVPEINKNLSKGNFDYVMNIIRNVILIYIPVHIVVTIVSYEAILYLHSYKYEFSAYYLLIISMGFLPQSIMLILTNVIYFIDGPKLVAKLILSGFFAQCVFSYIISLGFSIEYVLVQSLIFNTIILLCIIHWFYKAGLYGNKKNS